MNEKTKCKEIKYPYIKLMIKVVKPDKDIKSSIWELNVSIFLAVVVAFFVAKNDNTLFIFSQIVDLLQNIYIAFIAMEMGAYALFQALLKNDLVYRLYVNDNMLEESNQAFLGVILLFWFCIFTNILLQILFLVLPPTWRISHNYYLNTCTAFVCILLYMSLCIRVLFEVRNFAINLYTVFQAHNKVSLLEYLEEKKKEEEKKEEEKL